MIHTSRLTLRPFVAEDANFILKLVNQPDWLKFIGDKNVNSTSDAIRYIDEGPLAMYQTHGYGLTVIELTDSKMPIGMCGLIKREALTEPDLGFALLRDYYGNGYALEAANAIIQFAEKQLDINKILAIATPENSASIRLLEKLGFAFAEPIRDQNDKALNCYALLINR